MSPLTAAKCQTHIGSALSPSSAHTGVFQFLFRFLEMISGTAAAYYTLSLYCCHLYMYIFMYLAVHATPTDCKHSYFCEIYRCYYLWFCNIVVTDNVSNSARFSLLLLTARSIFLFYSTRQGSCWELDVRRAGWDATLEPFHNQTCHLWLRHWSGNNKVSCRVKHRGPLIASSTIQRREGCVKAKVYWLAELKSA